jgi:flagellar biosynthetic protein FliS
MNPYASQVGAYQTSNLANLRPGDQVALLLTTAARHMRTAKEYLLNKDYEERTKATEKSVAILEGLASVLDVKDPSGEKIAKELEEYYMSMITMISHMNVTNDEKLCDAIARALDQMADTWRDGQNNMGEDTSLTKDSPTPENFNLSA